MDDQEIINLYWCRSEIAISATAVRYGSLCYHVAYNILCDRGDSEECVNDTYLRVWNAIPPTRPRVFPAFLSKITRNLAFARWRSRNADKRGGGELTLVLDELSEICGSQSAEEMVLSRELAAALRQFLSVLPETERQIFLCRYWYAADTKTIAARFRLSEGNVRTTLYRTRKKLQATLQKEGLL